MAKRQGPAMSPATYRRSPRRRSPRRPEEQGAALFALGLVLFSPLILTIFDRGAATAVWGIPLLYLYTFAAWGLLIVMLAAIVETALVDRSPGAGAEPAPEPGLERAAGPRAVRPPLPLRARSSTGNDEASLSPTGPTSDARPRQAPPPPSAVKD